VDKSRKIEKKFNFLLTNYRKSGIIKKTKGQEDKTMTKREYKGYIIEKVTRLDFTVRKDGRLYFTEEDKNPRTLKEAKALIDRLTA
jgi:hypothetical protein